MLEEEGAQTAKQPMARARPVQDAMAARVLMGNLRWGAFGGIDGLVPIFSWAIGDRACHTRYAIEPRRRQPSRRSSS